VLDSVFGISSPGTVIATFAYCLLLAAALEAVRRGRRAYILVAIGLAAALYARMAVGFIDPTLDIGFKAFGLALAAVVVAFDLVFETKSGA
jgi:uncharacterized membrane protein